MADDVHTTTPSTPAETKKNGTSLEKPELLADSLQQMEIHSEWIEKYRNDWNQSYFELAFDRILKTFNPPPDATITDFGCGTCAHAIRVARHGYRVRALDFSEPVLHLARTLVAQSGLQTRIEIDRADLTSLPLPSDSCPYGICWGVLMHIPNIEKAVAELARVTAPGGMLAVSELNMRSLELRAFRILARLLGKPHASVRRPAGIETCVERPTGSLLVRHTDIPWLVNAFASHRLRLQERISGQFTESYVKFTSPLALRLIHGLNNGLFRHFPMPRFATGNILFFSKSRD